VEESVRDMDISAMEPEEFWSIVDYINWANPATRKRPVDEVKADIIFNKLVAREDLETVEGYREAAIRLESFVRAARIFYNELYKATTDLEKRLNTQVGFSSDGFGDLIWHIVGLGREQYGKELQAVKTGNLELMLKRERKSDYVECFGYLMPFVTSPHHPVLHPEGNFDGMEDLHFCFPEYYKHQVSRYATSGYNRNGHKELVDLAQFSGASDEEVDDFVTRTIMPDADQIAPAMWRAEVLPYYEAIRIFVRKMVQQRWVEAARYYDQIIAPEVGRYAYAPDIGSYMSCGYAFFNMVKPVRYFLEPQVVPA